MSVIVITLTLAGLILDRIASMFDSLFREHLHSLISIRTASRRRSAADHSFPTIAIEALEERLVLAAPVAVDDLVLAVENQSLDVQLVTANDTDPDGDSVSIIATTTPSHGTLSTVGGRLLFQPGANYTGDDSFTYTIADPDGNQSTATVNVSVNASIDVAAARTQILAGVGLTLPNPTQPGLLLPYGPTAFSLANENGQDSTRSVLAASTLGAGRIVAMNDHQWLNMSSYGSDTNMGAVYRNSIDWLGQQVSGTAGSKTIKVVTLNNQPNADWLTSQGYTNVVNATWTTLATELSDTDVFITGWMGNSVSTANLKIVENYLKGGGGVFVTDYGAGYNWWWNKPVEEAPVNLLLEDAGIFLTSNIIWTGGPVAVQHATEELSGYDVLNIINKSVSVDAGTETLALQTFATLLTSLPNGNALRSALSAAFAEHRFGDVQASPGNSISTDLDKARLTAEASWLQGLPVDEIPPHPSAADLYGAIPADAIRTASQTFSVDVSVTGLIATGAYAVPGEIVTMEVPAEIVGQGYQFRINGHVDNISSRGSWDRLPFGVSKSFTIDSTTIQIVNSFGGTIYLDIGEGAAGIAPTIGRVDLNITGAIEAPTFVLGNMADTEWLTERLKPGAYAELISEHLAISVPSSWIRDLDNPTALMTYWNDAIEFMDWVGAVEQIRTGPERFNVDVQISAGLLHAGNPIQGPIWASEEIVNLDYLQLNGNWGYFHELGHEKQRNNTLGHGYNSAWTFDGDTEVTVNIFANAALELHVPNSPTGGWGYSVYPDLVLERAVATVSDLSKPNFENKDPYPFYFQLADGPWGWQGYRDVLATYVDDYLNTPNELPANNSAEKDQWLIRWSQISGYDLTRYMVTNWGLEVSPSAIAEVAALNFPEWMPLIGRDDVVASHIGESVTFNVLDNDLTLDGMTVVDSFTPVSSGTLVDNGSGSFTFTPAMNQSGDATFTYVVSNVSGQTSDQTVTIGPPKPFAWWKLDDTDGTSVVDSSGNNRDGSVTGAVWSDGAIGGGLKFDGVDDEARFGNGPSLSGKTDFTLAAWVRTTMTSTGVIIQQRNGGFNGEYQLKVNPNGTLGFFLYGNNAYQYDFSSTATINDGEWHHVAAVRSGTNGLLYIDGVQAATAAGPVRDLAASIGVGVGADIRDNNKHFSGTMDDIRIYDTALTAADIALLSHREADLAATTFNAVADHLVNGQTDVTFSISNTGGADAGPFIAQVVWSKNAFLGDDDDAVLTAATQTFPGLEAAASVSRTFTIQLDKADLFSFALQSTPEGLPVGTVSTEVGQLFLIVDAAHSVAESNEDNNAGRSHLIDSDDITYFPWDKNGNGTVEPLEAISSIQHIGTSETTSDFDGNGIVTPLEALSAAKRIGYLRPAVVGDSPSSQSAALAETSLQSSHMPPAMSLPILAEAALVSSVDLRSAENATVNTWDIFDDDDPHHKLFASVTNHHVAAPIVPQDLPRIDEEFSDPRGWLTLI